MIKLGIDIFIEQLDKYRYRNIALLVNHTSCSSQLHYLWDILDQHQITINRIFTPEHGLFALEQDQVPVSSQPNLGFQVSSLYGDNYNSLIPNEADLNDVDCILFDIQDVGVRFNTYINTMILLMQKINGMDIELIILDRPNPLGGNKVEGPLLKREFNSFVGFAPVPVQHGMTVGEIALLAKEYFRLRTIVKIIKMKGWERTMLFQNTGLYWIAPSPNMPSLNTALVYPGMCLLEGTNVSEGRGTTTPFEQFGAPFIKAEELSGKLNALRLDGVYFRPVCFKPTFHKYANQPVNGIYVHVTDVAIFNAFHTGVAVIKTLYDLYDEFKFEEKVYEFETRHLAFDLLNGSGQIRLMIESNETLEKIRASWILEAAEFVDIKKEFHLY